MATKVIQSKWIENPYEDGQRTPNSQCTVKGTGTLAAGTLEVTVPFGTAIVTGVQATPSATTASATALAIASDGVITSNAVSFFSLGSTSSTDDFWFDITGRMDEAPV